MDHAAGACLDCHAPAPLGSDGEVRLRVDHREEGVTCISCHLSAEPCAMGGMLAACHALENAIQESWLAFARRGDPSNDTIGAWPRYGERRETMILGEKCAVENAPRDEERQAWTGLEGTGRI